jgi:hypothetical protein
VPTLRYNDYYISVFHIPDKSGNSSCIPCVEMRHKRDQSPSARLTINEAFSSAQDASAHGFAMGKQWVDERVAQRISAQSGGIATKTTGASQPLRLGKSWLPSSLWRFVCLFSRRSVEE